MTETTVFQSGNSQAVRLPKECRFKGKDVEIFRRGDEVVLREKPRTMGDVLASLPPITEADGTLRAHLRALGTPIGPTDLWIAAHALAPDLTLVSGNEREDAGVPTLRVENWMR